MDESRINSILMELQAAADADGIGVVVMTGKRIGSHFAGEAHVLHPVPYSLLITMLAAGFNSIISGTDIPFEQLVNDVVVAARSQQVGSAGSVQ
jgi:hypothetical protein